MFNNVQRGADPELFLTDAKGRPVSSIGLIGGSKDDPRPIGDGYALQEDNVAVEFNIPPANNCKAFVDSIQYVLKHLEMEVGEMGLSLAIVPTLEFDKASLSHPQARTMGCDPDYNAYTLEENPRPIAPEALRSAGGHLHLSWDNPTDAQREEIIRAHDLFCGVPSIEIDTDTQRRQIYGKPGAFRYKFYGAEWRTPSNFWIKSTELIEWMYAQSEKAVAFLNAGNKVDVNDYHKIQDCIINSDKKLLAELSEKYAI